MEKYQRKNKPKKEENISIPTQLTISSRCHGEKDNKVFELVNPYNLLGRPDSEEIKCFIYKGTSSKDVEKIMEVLEHAVDVADKNNAKSISQCLREA